MKNADEIADSREGSMTDITARLREMWCLTDGGDVVDPVAAEAADLIDSYRAERTRDARRIAALEAERDALLADARRWRRLRDARDAHDAYTAVYFNTCNAADLDAAIDAALEKP